MRYLLLLCVLLLPACGLVSAQQRNARMKSCQDSTKPAESSAAACTQLLGDHSLSSEERVLVHFWRGQASIRNNDLPAALGDLDESIKLDPTRAASHGMRGFVHGMQGDLPAAIDDFTRAIELDPSQFVPFQNRAKAFSDSGDQERAIKDYTRVIELGADSAIPRNGRCWSLAILGRELDAALSDCDKAVQLAPADANTFNSRGFVRYRRGDYAGAVRDYSASLALNPDSASSNYMRGRAKAGLGDPTAGQDIDKGVAIEAGVVERYAGYGVAP